MPLVRGYCDTVPVTMTVPAMLGKRKRAMQWLRPLKSSVTVNANSTVVETLNGTESGVIE